MSGIGSNNGWLEAAIAWEVCASLHRQYCKGKDDLFTTRQSDFVKHAENAREHISHGQAPLREGEWINDAGRIKWLLWRVQDLEAKLAARAPADSVTAPAGGVVSGPSEPTAEMYRAAQKFVYSTGEDGGSIVLNTSQVRALWQAMRAAAVSPAVAVREPVFAFRRKGLDDFCTCTEKRYAELSAKPNLFETRIFYTTPPAQSADSVLEDAARLERERICAAIKAEDDYCVDNGDYMLDSDDCIKIVRGEWVRPDFAIATARKQGANHDNP